MQPQYNPSEKDLQRFWSKVDVRDQGACWLWVGAIAPNGYGLFFWGRRGRGAHRVAWEIAHGLIPEGLCVLHHCDVKNCVNPNHLFLGTKRDNYQDSKKKGRNAKGEKHGMSKLSEENAQEIRRRYQRRSKNNNQYTLAQEFGVAQSHISAIINRLWWRH